MESLNKYQAIIGSDEAGKGEWLGPLTIAAVAVTPQQSLYLVTQGVMDSKELRMETMKNLVDIIQKECISYHVVLITPSRFNEFLQEVKREGKSLNDILAWGHSKAISQVYSELQKKRINGKMKLVIDEFDKIKTERRLKRVLTLREFDFEQKPRAEEETAVAAASILARVARELWIDEKSKRLNVDLRRISATVARDLPNVKEFAKLSFLHHK